MYDTILSIHIPVALSCVPAFWVPIFTKKGGRAHVRVGRYFTFAMLFVALSGMFLGAVRLLDPADRLVTAPTQAALDGIRGTGVFFLYLGIITLTPTLFGWRIVRTRRDPLQGLGALDRALLMSAVAGSAGIVAAAFLMPNTPTVLFLALSPIGLSLGVVGLLHLRDPMKHRMGWWYAHAGMMLGAGIASHTAFSVFVVGRWIAPGLTGFAAVLPWILPTLVGVPAIFITIAKAKQRFGEA